MNLIGRDTWYMAFTLVAAGSLAFGFAYQQPRTRAVRYGSLMVCVCAAWLALAARETAVISNTVILGTALVLVLGGRWSQPAAGRKRRAARLALLVGGALAGTLVLYVSQTGLRAALDVVNIHPEQYNYDYDLAGMSTREHRDLFPHSILPPSKLPTLERYFDVEDVDTLVDLPGSPLPLAALDARQVEAERRAEIKAVLNSPGTWLELHGQEFFRQISITTNANVVMQPDLGQNPLGYHERFPTLDRVASDYVHASHRELHRSLQVDWSSVCGSYLIITLVGAWVLLRRWRDPGLLILGALALSTLAYQVGLFLAPGVQYRLEVPTVAVGIHYADRRRETCDQRTLSASAGGQ